MKIRATFVALIVLATAFTVRSASALTRASKRPTTATTAFSITINGKQVDVKPGDKLPEVRASDVVKVVSGEAAVVVPGGDVVKASGSDAGFKVSPTGGTLSVTSTGGTVTVIDKSGNADNLAPNASVTVAQASSYFANGSAATFTGVAVQNTQQNTRNQAVSGSNP